MRKFLLAIFYPVLIVSMLYVTGCATAPNVKEPVDVSHKKVAYWDLSVPTLMLPAVTAEIKKYENSKKWKYVVIHHSASTAGNAADFDKMHRKRGWDRGLGYHFVVGNGNGSGNGLIEIGTRWEKQIDGAHAGVKEYNRYGIGICLVGNFENGVPTAEQMDSLLSLVNHFQDRYKIPSENVILHRHVRSTACPGRQFPYFEVLSNIKAY